MKTWEDLKNSGNDKIEFISEAISEHKTSRLFGEGAIGLDYFSKRNTTITKYQKLLYTMSGEAVPDNYSANYKFCNAFFPIFVKQENSFLLANGVTFNDDSTKEKIGGDEFDTALMEAGECALWGGVSFGFFNLDHIEVFKITEFVPLFGEEDGALHAGIRFWQIDDSKPLRATLYEEDGYTEYIYRKGKGEVLKSKRAYKQIVRESIADGTEIYDGDNYPNFPIVPLWANNLHQSEIIGLREKIDGYDLIQSGLCNTIDEASIVYWTITNAGGMDDIDLAKFLERMKTVKASVVDEQGSQAEAHTLDVPYQATQMALQDLRDSLYRDAMALDTDKISAGNVTATAIQASYENLELKCDGYEYCVTTFIKGILALAGIDDAPTYKRSKVMNQQETTQMILSAGDYLDDETVLNLLPFLNIDQVDEILKRKDEEEADRFAQFEDEDEDDQNPDGNDEEVNADEEGQGKDTNR